MKTVLIKNIMREEDRLDSFLMSSTLRAARGLDFLRCLQDEQHVLSDQDAFDSHVHSREAEKENHKDQFFPLKSLFGQQ